MGNSSKLIVETTNPDQLFKILNAIKEHGNVGHSFTIVIDEDDEREEKFGWDGDGSDRIEEIYITSDRDSKNKIFNLIKSKCKTKSQRLAFNKLVKSFSSASGLKNDLMNGKFVYVLHLDPDMTESEIKEEFNNTKHPYYFYVLASKLIGKKDYIVIYTSDYKDIDADDFSSEIEEWISEPNSVMIASGSEKEMVNYVIKTKKHIFI